VIDGDYPVDTEPDLVRLKALLDETQLAVVVEGGRFDARQMDASRVLARVDKPADLDWLRSVMRCLPGSPRQARNPPGGPTIALFAADHRFLAAVTLVGWGHIRSPGLLEGEVLLVAPARFLQWLAGPGGFGRGV
jgi:hypothetical protein